MIKIGVLGIQGSVIEHINMLRKIENVQAIEVKRRDELEIVDGLILPGGESTAQGKLISEFGLKEIIIKRANDGMPIWGTCCGMILLAKHIVNQNYTHLDLMDIYVRRNAYGSQIDSFKTRMLIPKVSKDEITLVFIRAPYIERVGEGVEVLAELNGKIIAAEQGNLLVTSFHPELTDDLSFHKYFISKVQKI